MTNENNSAVDKLNNLFHVSDVYGFNSKEFEMRLNHIENVSNEEINSIITVRDGSATNNNTGERINAVFFNTDINTVIQNNVLRFKLNEVNALLPDLMMTSEERINKILNKMN